MPMIPTQPWSTRPVEPPPLSSDGPLPDLSLQGESAPATPSVLDAHELLRAVVRECQPSIRARRLDVSFRLLARNHYVSADAERLRTVFGRLIRLAVDATPPGGQITVRSSRPSDCALRIEVEERSPALRSRTPSDLSEKAAPTRGRAHA